MRRTAVTLLILAFAALGSGLLLHVHNHAHEVGQAEHEHAPFPGDTSTCDLHGKLTLPVISGSVTPLLISLGLLIAFLTQLSPAWIWAFAHVRLDCRGPPVC